MSRSNEQGTSDAAGYIVDEINSYLQRLVPNGREQPQIAELLGLPENNHLGKTGTVILSRVIKIMEASPGSLSLERFGLKTILDALVSSLRKRGRPEALSICNRFLQIFWQLYHLAPGATRTWSVGISHRVNVDYSEVVSKLSKAGSNPQSTLR